MVDECKQSTTTSTTNVKKNILVNTFCSRLKARMDLYRHCVCPGSCHLNKTKNTDFLDNSVSEASFILHTNIIRCIECMWLKLALHIAVIMRQTWRQPRGNCLVVCPLHMQWKTLLKLSTFSYFSQWSPCKTLTSTARGETIHHALWYIVTVSSRYVSWYRKIDKDMHRFCITILFYSDDAVKKSEHIQN